MNRILVLLTTSWLLFTLASTPIYGQGTFSCQYSRHGLCSLRDNNCDAAQNFVPGHCSAYDNNRPDCEKPHDCLLPDQVTRCVTKWNYFDCPAAFPAQCHGGPLCCVEIGDCTNNISVYRPLDPSCDGGAGVNTALGCIPVNDLNTFVAWILSKVIFVASGIAFLLMAYGAIQILTSAGKPESVKAGGELITSALLGLVFILLALFLLKLIGVDILQIPGFGP